MGQGARRARPARPRFDAVTWKVRSVLLGSRMPLVASVSSRSGYWALGMIATLAVGAGCTVRTPPIDAGRDGGPQDTNSTTPDVPAIVEDAPRDTSYDAPLIIDPDAACASASAPAMVERLPVDIIWVVDNSSSMAPAIAQVRAGINAFADQLFASGLDYRMILLSLREPRGGGTYHTICIDPPLAGPACGDGERFFHIDVNIGSTKPIEQILGTLAQLDGYTDSANDGSAPWRALLRPEATKTIVVVSDDNSRTCARPVGTCAGGDPPLTATSLEDFPGGGNPFNSGTLGPGILDPSYGGLFDGYTFNAIYGWGSETDPDVECTYTDGSAVEAAGHTYSTLVERTGGVRAQICDGAAAWGPFFDSVATSVLGNSRIACDLAIPPPPEGMLLLPGQVNVLVDGTSGEALLPRVLTMSACDPTRGGWYYDDNAAPTQIFLCPASCEFAQAEVTEPGTGLNVLFGCDSILM